MENFRRVPGRKLALAITSSPQIGTGSGRGARKPAVSLTVPARIVQATDDQRVRANPSAPLKGTDQLVTELQDKAALDSP